MALGLECARHEIRPALGDARDVGEGDRELVHRQRDGHAVEVRTRDDVARALGVVGEHEGVVGDGAELELDRGRELT